MPLVSIIAVLDRPATECEQMLKSALEQSDDDYEVVIACAGEEAPGEDEVRDLVAACMPEGASVAVRYAACAPDLDAARAAGFSESAGSYVYFADPGLWLAPGIVTMTDRKLEPQDAQLMCLHLRVLDSSRGEFRSRIVATRHDNGKLPLKAFPALEHPGQLFQLVPGDTGGSVFSAEFLRREGLAPAGLVAGYDDPLVYRTALTGTGMCFLNLPLAQRTFDYAGHFASLTPEAVLGRAGQVASLAPLLDEGREALRPSYIKWAVDYVLEGLQDMPAAAQEAVLDFAGGELAGLVERYVAEGVDVPPRIRQAVEFAGMSRARLVERSLELAALADEHEYDRAYLSLIAERDGAGIPVSIKPAKKKHGLFRR